MQKCFFLSFGWDGDFFHGKEGIGKGFLVGLVSLLFRFFGCWFCLLRDGFKSPFCAIEAFLGIVWVGPPPLPSNSGKMKAQY